MNKRSPARLSGAVRPGSSEAGTSGAVRPEAGQLPPEKQPLVAELLVEGATFEDVVETVNEGEGPKVTQGAVERFFRSNLELQKRRVARLVEKAEALKTSLQADPNSAERKLAEAALLTGLMRLSRGGAELTVKDAMSLRLQQENLRLRQRVVRMKDRDAILKHALTEARAHHEFERLKLTREKVRLLRRNLKGLRKGQQLGPETFQKIQEIYGILDEPYTPPKHQAANSEPPAA
jgi:hypothetical protein